MVVCKKMIWSKKVRTELYKPNWRNMKERWGGGKPAVAVCNTDEAEPESNNRKTEITPGEHHSFYLLG